MIDIDNFDSKKAIVLIIGIFGIFLLAWFISLSIGVLFSETSDTVEIENNIDIFEDESHINISVIDESYIEYFVPYVDNQEIQWDDNQISINKSESEDIQIQSVYTINGEEQIYDTKTINPILQEYSINIDEEDENYLKNIDYTISINYESEQPMNINWFINDERINEQEETFEYLFDDSGEYDISLTAEVSDREIEYSEQFYISEPDDINIEASVRNTDVDNSTYKTDEIIVEQYDELDFIVEELSESNIDTYQWDFDDGTMNQGETQLKWYIQPDEYNVSVVAENEKTGITETDNINVVVEEPEEEQETNRLTINTFDAVTGERVENVDITIDNIVSDTTTEEGQLQYDLPINEYNIIATHEDYETYEESSALTDNTVVDMRLIPEMDDEDDINDEIEEDEQTFLGQETNISADFETDVINETEEDQPTQYDEILDNMDGNGTVDNPYIIKTVVELQAMNGDPGAYYELGKDINAEDTQLWGEQVEFNEQFIGTVGEEQFETVYAPISEDSVTIQIEDSIIDEEEYIINEETGNIILTNSDEYNQNSNVYISYQLEDIYSGFEPIQSQGKAPVFDGKGYEINNLNMQYPTQNNVGLFESVDGSIITNVTFNGARITGSNNVGTIVGETERSIIEDINVGSQIVGERNTGSIVGSTQTTSISNVSSFSGVIGEELTGGLVGQITDDTTIEQSRIESPMNSLTILKGTNTGGLVGLMSESDIQNSYTLSDIQLNTNSDNIGGFVGIQLENSTINTSYTVTQIDEQYSEDIGSIAGELRGEINNMYWDSDVMDSETEIITQESDEENISITNLETDEMQGEDAEENMDGFNFEDVWETVTEPEDNYPVFQHEQEEITVPDSLVITETDISNDTDVIDIGDIISTSPTYWNELNDILDITIYESNYEVTQENIDNESSVTITQQPVINDSQLQLTDFEVHEENEIDVLYTVLDDNNESINSLDNELEIQVLDEDGFVDDADIIIEHQSLNYSKKHDEGDFFENNIPSGLYNVSITSDTYENEQDEIEIIEDKTVEYNLEKDEDIDSEVTGVVEGSKIEGATVKAIENYAVIDETETNEDGEYLLNIPEEYTDSADIVVNFDSHGEQENIAGGGLQDIDNQESVDFDFNASNENVHVHEMDINDGDVEEVRYLENEEEYKQITNAYQLQAINESLDSNYVLSTNINASITSEWDETFTPIGSEQFIEDDGGIQNYVTDFEELGDVFTGELEGNNQKIIDLTINQDNYVNSLFVGLSESNISNLTMKNANITNLKEDDEPLVSNLAGITSETQIENIQLSGSTLTSIENSTTMSSGLISVIHDTQINDVVVKNNDMDTKITTGVTFGNEEDSEGSELKDVTIKDSLLQPYIVDELERPNGLFLSAINNAKLDGINIQNNTLESSSELAATGLATGIKRTKIENVNFEDNYINSENSEVTSLIGTAIDESNISSIYSNNNTIISDAPVTSGVIGNNRGVEIKDVYISDLDIESSYQGEFEEASGTSAVSSFALEEISMNNISVMDSNIEGHHATSGVISVINGGELNNINVENSTIQNTNESSEWSGGIVGITFADTEDTSVNIYNSTFDGELDTSVYSGGIIGYSEDINIENSYTKGELNGESILGGIAGYIENGEISNSYTTMDISTNEEESTGSILGVGSENVFVSESVHWLENTFNTGIGVEDNNETIFEATGKDEEELTNSVIDETNLEFPPFVETDMYPCLEFEIEE